MSIDEIVSDYPSNVTSTPDSLALQHYKILSSLPRKKEELPDNIRRLLEKRGLIESDKAQRYYLTIKGNSIIRKIEFREQISKLRKDLPTLSWCFLYASLGIAGGWATLDALFRSESPSMLDSIANSSIIKAEIASPVITYAGVPAATAIENRVYNGKVKHALGLNSTTYICGLAVGLMLRTIYTVATKG